MRRFVLDASLTAVSAVAGGAAWYSLDTLPLAFVLPAVWALSSSRWAAFAVTAAYYLAFSRGLVIGTATYFDAGLWSGATIWLSAGVALGGCWALAWSNKPFQRPLRLVLALLATALPPVGIVGWASPLTAAGALFPSWGWLGLIVAIVMLMVTAWQPRLAIFPVILGILVPTTTVSTPENWSGHDSALSYRNEDDLIGAFNRQRHWIETLSHESAGVHVLPESTAGIWTDTSTDLWQSLDQRQRVLMGAAVPAGNFTDNVVIDYHAGRAAVAYRQRVPVPLGMWRPWDAGTTRAHWFSNPVADIDGRTVAPLICYEIFLVWPVLQSMAAGGDLLMGVANDWWSSQTSIPTFQHTSIAAWGALFGVPVVTATNT